MSVTLKFYPQRKMSIDVDGEIEVEAKEEDILNNFTASEVIEHFGADALLEWMDDSDVVEYLKGNNYQVDDLDGE
jgi:hypothetical protein